MLSRWRRRGGDVEFPGVGGDSGPGGDGRTVLGLRARLEAARMRAVDDLVDRVLEPPTPLPDAQAAADRVLHRLHGPRLSASEARGPFPWKPALVASGILVTAGVAFAGLRRRGLVRSR